MNLGLSNLANLANLGNLGGLGGLGLGGLNNGKQAENVFGPVNFRFLGVFSCDSLGAGDLGSGASMEAAVFPRAFPSRICS